MDGDRVRPDVAGPGDELVAGPGGLVFLAPFLPPEVAELVHASPSALSLQGELEATILFSDIRGFSTLAERLAPRQVAEVVGRHPAAQGPPAAGRGVPPTAYRDPSPPPRSPRPAKRNTLDAILFGDELPFLRSTSREQGRSAWSRTPRGCSTYGSGVKGLPPMQLGSLPTTARRAAAASLANQARGRLMAGSTSKPARHRAAGGRPHCVSAPT